MDDEFEIRERNAKIVMRLLGEAEREVIPVYAQELFVGFLLNKLYKVGKHEIIAVLTLIVINGSDGESSFEDNIVEYRVFDKNEINIFSETFILKRICANKLKEKIEEIFGESIDDNISQIVDASQRLKNTKSKQVVDTFLRTLMKAQPEI